jgi:hypothetical protein
LSCDARSLRIKLYKSLIVRGRQELGPRSIGVNNYQTNKKDFQMAERIKTQAVFSTEEILRTEILINQALIDILISKQFISEVELVNSIQKIRLEQEKTIKWLP